MSLAAPVDRWNPDRSGSEALARAGMAQLVETAHGYAARYGVAAIAHEIATRTDDSLQLREELKARTVTAASAAVSDHPALVDELFTFAVADELSHHGASDATWLRLPREKREESVAMFVATVLTHECLLHARKARTNAHTNAKVNGHPCRQSSSLRVPMTGHDANVAAPSHAPDSDAAMPVLAMLRVLELPALAELEHALSLHLEPASSAAQRRWGELGALATLLNQLQPLPAQDVPRLERGAYEEHRSRHTPEAPDHRTLVARYGSWRKACRAAYGLLPDGRYTGVGSPWPSPFLGRARPSEYTRDDLYEAIRRSALELARVPSSHDYHRWTREKKRRARQSGASVRTPSIGVVYRFYPKGENRWQLALADARLSEVEIAQARARKLLGRAGATLRPDEPLTRLRLLRSDQLAAAGISGEERARIEHDGFGWLPLERAAGFARHLGGSIDWLAGRAIELGRPPGDDVTLQPDALAGLLTENKVKPKRIRDQLDLAVGPYRDLVTGKREPILAELLVIAHELNSEIGSFVFPAAPSGSQRPRQSGALGLSGG